MDLCFLLDATASMGPWIDKIKMYINNIVVEVRRVFNKAEVRIACVVYRDFDMGNQSFQVLNFVTDPNLLSSFLTTVLPNGGAGNGGEDVNGGL